MTEPLLLATDDGRGGDADARGATDDRRRSTSTAPAVRRPTAPAQSRVGVAFALACLTRYEAWPVTVSALVAAAWARWRRGAAARGRAARRRRDRRLPRRRDRRASPIFSRVVVGAWFVGSDFFVPENKALGDPMMARDGDRLGRARC